MSRTAVVYYEKTETYKVKITDNNKVYTLTNDVKYNGETYYITITLTEEEDGDFVHYEIY